MPLHRTTESASAPIGQDAVPMLARRNFLAVAAALALSPVFAFHVPLARPIAGYASARMWKLEFAAEFAKAIDIGSCPNVLEMLAWIIAAPGML